MPRSRTAAVNCSFVMTPTAEDDAPAVICSEDCGTLADVETADSGVVVPDEDAGGSGWT